MDENRELRAMLFSVIHIPPLPSIVSRIDRDDMSVIDDSAVESSHSIIGSMLEWTAMANNQAANNNRMNMQSALLTQFRSDLNKLDLVKCSDEDLYNFYCYHTRAWLNTYSKVGNMMCFKPLDYVLNNDKTHQNMRGYTKAQYHLFTDGKETLELEDSVQYADLLRKCAQWTKEAYASESMNDGDFSAKSDADITKNQPEEQSKSIDISTTEQTGNCDDYNNFKNSTDEIYVAVQGEKTVDSATIVTDSVTLTSKVATVGSDFATVGSDSATVGSDSVIVDSDSVIVDSDSVIVDSDLVTLGSDYMISTSIDIDEATYNIVNNTDDSQNGAIVGMAECDQKSIQAEALRNTNGLDNSNTINNAGLTMGLGVDFF
jgi:hypothetical protein